MEGSIVRGHLIAFVVEVMEDGRPLVLRKRDLQN